MPLSKPVGLLLDTIYGNTGDKAIRIAMAQAQAALADRDQHIANIE